MKKISEMSNKELSRINHILLIITLIGEIGILIENIVWFDDYSPAAIFLTSLAISCAIYAIIDKIKRDKRLKKRKDEFNERKENN